METDIPTAELLAKANSSNMHLGIDVSDRIKSSSKRHLIKLTFTDIQSEKSVDELISFFKDNFEPHGESWQNNNSITLDPKLLRQKDLELPGFSFDELSQYYQKLAELNVSPDDGCYPLGSCTMKYNPLLNDWAASFLVSRNVHPQAPETDCQGPVGNFI